MKTGLFLFLSVFIFHLKASAQLNWQTFNVPGALSTWVDGIDGNVIVGSYSDEGTIKGFTYNRQTEQWNYLQAPDYGWTLPLAISGNTIVGAVGQNTSYIRNGFIFKNTTDWSFLNSPEHGQQLEALGIDGTLIVGETAGGLGFIYNDDNGTWSYFNTPDGKSASFDGISGSTIVGTYFSASDPQSIRKGFVKNGESWTLLDVENAVETLPRDVDGNHVVGQFRESLSGPTRSFFYDGSSLIYLDAPGADSTYAWGVDANTIVGSYNDSTGASQGFILTVPEPSALSLLAVGLGVLFRRSRKRD